MSRLTNLNLGPAAVFRKRPWMCLKGLIILLHIPFSMVVCAQENIELDSSIKELYKTGKEESE